MEKRGQDENNGTGNLTLSSVLKVCIKVCAGISCLFYNKFEHESGLKGIDKASGGLS